MLLPGLAASCQEAAQALAVRARRQVGSTFLLVDEAEEFTGNAR
jgi:hypothetical protein